MRYKPNVEENVQINNILLQEDYHKQSNSVCLGWFAMMGLVVKSVSPTRPCDMHNCWRAVLNNHISPQKVQTRKLNNTKGNSLK